MAELIHLKIKAMSFDRLIKELHSLKDMYIDFSNNNSNIIATSTFHIVAKDLDTLVMYSHHFRYRLEVVASCSIQLLL